MTTATQHILDLDLAQGDEMLTELVAKTIADLEPLVQEKGTVELVLVTHKPGSDDSQRKTITLTPERYLKAGQEVVFPRLVESILSKEFPKKVAQNEQLQRHVMEELKRDPYWSTQVIELVKQLKAR
jgi:hypothetical protein